VWRARRRRLVVCPWNCSGAATVIHEMRAGWMVLGLAVVAMVACQAPGAPSAAPTTSTTTMPTPTPSPTPTAVSGVQALLLDLRAKGAAAKVGSQFLAEPLGGQGMTVCVGAETLQTYEFIDHEAAFVASTKIDRDDPSSVGGAIVEWVGQPRFWLRDRIIVLYLGDDAAIDKVLRELLGSPFAESEEGGPGFLPEAPCQ
jgi:hypothetical protein